MCLQAHQCRVRCHTTTRNDWKVTLTKNLFLLTLPITVLTIYIWCTVPGREFFDRPERAIWPLCFFFFFIVSGCYEESRHYQGNTKCRNEQRRVSELFLWEIIPTDSDRSFPHPSLRFKFLKRIPLFSNYCKFLHFVWCWRWSFSLFS